MYVPVVSYTASCTDMSDAGDMLRGSQWGGGFYGYRLNFWLFYGYRLIFFGYG